MFYDAERMVRPTIKCARAARFVYGPKPGPGAYLLLLDDLMPFRTGCLFRVLKSIRWIGDGCCLCSRIGVCFHFRAPFPTFFSIIGLPNLAMRVQAIVLFFNFICLFIFDCGIFYTLFYTI